ncbi:MAG: pyridoxal phosphate-dependent aminotransferase [Rhodanobacteraceae bacterium]
MSAQVEPFRAIAISRLAHELQAAGRSIIHMEFGQPSTGAPRAAIEAMHRVLDTSALGYWESPALKARIARHYGETYRVKVDPEQVVLTCGASPALLLAFISRFEPGDRVALARPGYVAYRNTLRALRMVPVELACGAASRYQLTAAAIEALDPPPAGVIIASPANPTGTIIAAAELEAIVAVCDNRNIQIISDEIYHGWSYTEPAHSITEFEPNAMVVNSFSKYYCMTGWRLGWLLTPPQHIERVRSYAGNLFLCAPTPSQHTALVAMDSREELDANIVTYRRNRTLLLQALPALGLDAIAPPDGAFYIYADVKHLTDDSMQFCIELLHDTGVAMAPGVDFDPIEGRHFVRMSFAASTDDMEEALSRLRPWFIARARVV